MEITAGGWGWKIKDTVRIAEKRNIPVCKCLCLLTGIVWRLCRRLNMVAPFIGEWYSDEHKVFYTDEGVELIRN